MGNCTMSPKTKKSSQIVVKSNSKEDLSNKKTSFDLVNQRDFDAQSFETSNCIMKEENISITKTNDSTNLNPKIFYPADVEPTIFPFFFAKNQKIVFNVSGIWSFFPEYGKTDFKGYTEIRDNNNLNVGQLMGRVCGGSPFAISKQHYKFISDSSGQLILYVNGDMVSAKPEGELQIIIEGQCPRLSQRDLDLLSHWNIPLINREDNKFSLSREEYDLIDLINKARGNPSQFAEQYLDKTNKNHKETYQMLKKYTPVGDLSLCDALCKAAIDHSIDLGKNGTNGHMSSNQKNTLGDRIRKYSKKSVNYYGENISFGKRKAYSIILDMLIDNNLKSKHNRYNILNESFTQIGVSIKPHISFKYGCVIVFGKDVG